MENTQKKLVENKQKIIEHEEELEMQTAQINSKTKNDWMELNITNSDGRKAYITKKTQKLKKQINEFKGKILENEAELKILNKKFNFMMLCYEMEVKQ